jgi:PAS domain S-box-containing protein
MARNIMGNSTGKESEGSSLKKAKPKQKEVLSSKAQMNKTALSAKQANTLKVTNQRLRSLLKEHERFEEKLKHSEGKFRSIFEESKDAIFITNPAGRFLYLNSAGVELFGFNNFEEIKGINVCELYVNPHDRKITLNELKKNGYIKDYEFLLKSKDGKQIIALETTFAVKDKYGRLIEQRGIIRDVTDEKRKQAQLEKMNQDFSQAIKKLQQEISQRKKIENALRESEERFREMADLLPQTVFETDCQGFLTFANRFAYELFGYSREDFQHNIHSLDMLVPKDRRRAKINILRIQKGNAQGTLEYTALRKDGSTFPILLYTSPIIRNHHTEGLRGLLVDITEQKRNEQALKKAKEAAEEGNRLKSRFLSSVSHDIRTPLNCIIGFSEIILNSNSIEEIHEKAKANIQQSEILLKLINDLLDHTRIESGKLKLEIQPVDLYKLMELIMNSVMVKERLKRDIQFNVVIDRDVPRFVKGDNLRLNQILINLVSNAVKFTPVGSITLRVDTLKLYPDSVTLKFSVIDTGIGIPDDKLKHIFESFTQADGSTTRKYGGTGLGTTIAKNLVLLMGGEIGVESHVGKGSTFWFSLSLPLCSKSESCQQYNTMSADVVKHNMEQINSSARILLAEDYPPNQEVVKLHLSNAAHSLDIAENGLKAVELAKKNKYDLILMDIEMPELDGYGTTKRIRAESPYCKSIPILAMTASADADTRNKCLQTGMNDVLIKPIRRIPFLATIYHWLGSGNQPVQPLMEENLMIYIEKDNDQENDVFAEPLNLQEAIMEFGGDENMFREIAGNFIQNVEKQIVIIKQALIDKNAEVLKQEAHRMKGGAANLTAMPLSDAAMALEKISRANQLEGAENIVNKIISEFFRLKDFMAG